MNKPVNDKEKKVFITCILLCFAVYLTGWFIPLMEVDAAQYANISREMLMNKSFLQVYDMGKDYLDKPPMLFWLSSLSMRMFGINDMAYRFPSFLFAILAVYSTYRLALLFYQQRIAFISALVLASCQAMFLITHDVRTDTMLMGCVITGIWQTATWFKTEKWSRLLVASLCIGGGLLTKGPIAIMVPIFSFIPHLLLQGSFRQLLRWQYLVALLVIGICLIPMCIGLYTQYDLHPEKKMYGQHGISGLRFYFWTQSFGRITGESTWHENDSFLFLFENMLWGFLPWIFFFVCGLVLDCIQLARNKFRIGPEQEWISDGGFIITYCALALSRAQLPHYIYIVFPLAAIITAKWIYKLVYTQSLRNWVKPFLTGHIVLFSLVLTVSFLLLYIPFHPVNKVLLFLFGIILFLILVLLTRKATPLPILLLLPTLIFLFVNFFMNTGFYPRLLTYQMSITASKVIKSKRLNKAHTFTYKLGEKRSLDFYANYSFSELACPDSLRVNEWLITSSEGYNTLNKNKYRVIYAGQSFHVSMLTLPFLDPARRNKETSIYYILQRL